MSDNSNPNSKSNSTISIRSQSEIDVEIALGNPSDEDNSSSRSSRSSDTSKQHNYLLKPGADGMKVNLPWIAITMTMELIGAQFTFAFAKTAFSAEMNAKPSLPDMLHDSIFGICDQAGNPMNDPNNLCVGGMSAFFHDIPDKLVICNLVAFFALAIYNGYRYSNWRRFVNLGAEVSERSECEAPCEIAIHGYIHY